MKNDSFKIISLFKLVNSLHLLTFCKIVDATYLKLWLIIVDWEIYKVLSNSVNFFLEQ